MQVNEEVVIHLNRGWPRRAAVCRMDSDETTIVFDHTRPDYPLRLVPFVNHELFESLEDSLQQEVLTWGWMGYNQRTITAEDCVVNPALQFVATSLQNPEDWHFHEAIRQTLIDEHFHTLMHLRSMECTRRFRNITRSVALPRSITYRRLQALKSHLQLEWERKLADIAFATVAEISVNAYLDIIAEDESIQPLHKAVAQRHNRDEYAHSKVLSEIVKVLYMNWDKRRQDFFIQILPQALNAFVAQDFSMWEAILEQLSVPHAKRIIADSREQPANKVLLRDYSGLRRLASEAGFLDRLAFDFGAQGGVAATSATELHP